MIDIKNKVIFSNKSRVVFSLLIIALFSVFYGCGKEIVKNPVAVTPEKTDFSNVILKGTVVPPLIDSLESEKQYQSLGGIQGTLVFLENRPDLYAYTDSKGDFSINNVPVGKYAVIAEKNDGYNIFKQRHDNINITGKDSVYKMEFSIPLELANYSLSLHLESINDEAPVDGTIQIWGRKFNTYDGGAKISSFPGGANKKELLITANGYQEETIQLSFGENKNSHIYVKLTPVNGGSNRAPVVEIEESEKKVLKNKQVRFSANAYDPDSDEITLKWEANRGNFINSNSNTVIYNAPNSIGPVTIFVYAEDSKKAIGRAVLNVNVVSEE